MGRPAATDDQRREQRNRIRHAAADLYREGGLPALSVRAVAKRAEISTGLLYRYFNGMSDLLRSLWIVPVAKLADQIEAIAAAEPDPVLRIEKLLADYVEWTEANPDVHRGLLLFVRPDAHGLSAKQDPGDLAFHRALRLAVEDGQASGQIRSGDSITLAEILWAGVHGALALPVNLDRYSITPSSELAPMMITSLVNSLRTVDGQTASNRKARNGYS